jgi:F0F1-type ATP synthase assembly protein I
MNNNDFEENFDKIIASNSEAQIVKKINETQVNDSANLGNKGNIKLTYLLIIIVIVIIVGIVAGYMLAK